jgi:hypothetical protein
MWHGIDDAGGGCEGFFAVLNADSHRDAERKWVDHIHITAVLAQVSGLRCKTDFGIDIDNLCGRDKWNTRRTPEIGFHWVPPGHVTCWMTEKFIPEDETGGNYEFARGISLLRNEAQMILVRPIVDDLVQLQTSGA